MSDIHDHSADEAINDPAPITDTDYGLTDPAPSSEAPLTTAERNRRRVFAATMPRLGEIATMIGTEAATYREYDLDEIIMAVERAGYCVIPKGDMKIVHAAENVSSHLVEDHPEISGIVADGLRRRLGFEAVEALRPEVIIRAAEPWSRRFFSAVGMVRLSRARIFEIEADATKTK